MKWVELHDHLAECIKVFRVVRVDERRTMMGYKYFRFYFGDGKYSLEYDKGRYSYHIRD